MRNLEEANMRRVNVGDELIKDSVFAFRLLKKSPGFTATAVLSLVLGIGANVAIFSLVDILLLRALPVGEPRRLLEVSRTGGGTLSYPMYQHVKTGNEVFSGVLAVVSGRMAAGIRIGGVDAGDAHFSAVSGDYFDVLRIKPTIGRTLTDADLGPSDAAVISHELWQRALGGDPSVLGKGLRLGRGTYTVVGVAQAGFRGIVTGQPVDVWVPVTWVGPLTNPEALMFRVIGRMKDGITEEQARAHVTVLGRQWDDRWRLEWKANLEVESASTGLALLRRRFSRPLLVLMTAVGLLLLIASVNVANLLLARGSTRQREIGVRLSLGAGRGRLVRQLLTESFVLGGIGAALGVMLAPPAAAFLVRFLVSAIGSVNLSVSIDARILAFTVFVLVTVVLSFGMAPALSATRLDLAPMFRGTGLTSLRGGGAARRLLLGTQVAICCLLLTGAVMFGRSLQSLNRVDAGFRPENVLLMGVEARGTLSPIERIRLFERARQRFTSVPGVTGAALSSGRLFGGSSWSEPLRVPDLVPAPGQTRDAVLFVVSPAFFQTMDTALLAGREFEPRDDERGAPVAIVNEAAARYFFGDTHPVSRTFHIDHRGFPKPLTIVGVVRDQKYRSLKEPAPRIVYLPYLQVPGAPDDATFVVRTADPAERMTDILRQHAKLESELLRIGGATPQTRLLQGTIAQDRMLAQLSACFGVAAALLVCLGLYGVTAYDVSRRTSELALRVALGAQPSHVVASVVGGSLLPAAVGIVVGLAAAVGLGRFVESLLFGVERTDPLTMIVSASIVGAVSAAAACLPARRAASADPVAALRREQCRS